MNMLIIFAKEPKGSRIKTRLRDVLSRRERVRLYNAFLQDIKCLILRVNRVKKVIAFDGPSKPALLKKLFVGFLFVKQAGCDLGERLYQAFCDGQENGGTRMVIIGSDAPDLPKALIRQAFVKLASHDLVIGPSRDGGYYLVGLNRPHKELFDRIPWSTEKVFKCTIQRAQKKKLRIAILRKWSDVDRPEDLINLKKRLQKSVSAKHTKEYFDGQ